MEGTYLNVDQVVKVTFDGKLNSYNRYYVEIHLSNGKREIITFDNLEEVKQFIDSLNFRKIH